MRAWSPEEIAGAAGAELLTAASEDHGPERAVIDSRAAGPDTLFVGLPGESAHGGRFARQALDGGAWGVLTDTGHAQAAADNTTPANPGVVLAAEDPLEALQRLATAWRRALKADVIGVTGSTGKTSTKDILLALLAPHRRTVASRENYNTEIGLPLEILNAPAGTEVLVLEMGMRGAGQIAELAAIAEPGVGVIVNVGPVHLELLGSIEAIAAAKAELIAGLPAGGTAVIPASEPRLEPHLRADIDLVTFGAAQADIRLVSEHQATVVIDARGAEVTLEVPFAEAHLRRNLLAAVGAAQAVGVVPAGRVDLALSQGRGQRTVLAGGVTLIDDCYNANPMSMSAALEELRARTREMNGGRRVAVLGDMLELGPGERGYHVELGDRASQAGVDVLVTVGPLAAAIADRFDGEAHLVADAGEAAALVPELLAPGDVVLVKGSRGVGLELVCEALRAVGAAS
jgi:UDP-N-acetylmuramoyl-tripeptide--D-alanyl-D-alanine ligase